MEDVSTTDIIVKQLNALHVARKAFIEAESNEKLHRALKAKNQITTGITYEIGDIVYYKCEDSNKWKGPGKVIDKEDKQILVKHGGYYIRVHLCSLQLVANIEPNKSEGTPGNNAGEFVDGTDEKNSNNNLIYTSDDESEFYPVDKVGKIGNVQANEGTDIDQLANSLNDLTIHPGSIVQCTSETTDNHHISNLTTLNNILPEVKSKVLYHNPDHNSWNKAYILGRAGETGGRNTTWFNVKDLTEYKHICVDFSKIQEWKSIDEEVLVAAQVNDSVEILEAKQALTNWRKHNVYDETEDVGQRVILVRWVIKQKFKNNKMIYKARLVARSSSIHKDSPTCCKDNFRLVLSIIVSNS